MSRPRRSCPYYNSGIEVFKIPRKLIESGLLMSLSADALRLFLIVSYGIYKHRSDRYTITLAELHQLGLTIEAANELHAVELLKLTLHSYQIKLTLPN
jgi:hypothetical protein